MEHQLVDASPALPTTFRPYRGRRVAQSVAVVAIVLFAAVAWLPPLSWPLSERVSVNLIGVAIAIFMSRYASIHAIASRDQLTVRNLFVTRSVTWEEVEGVHFDDRGMPWVRLTLTDGGELAVMAIQRADGPRSLSQAHLLAEFVERHRPAPTTGDLR